MHQLNWGLALASNGSYQVVDTTISPGIMDNWSEVRFESFTFFVAPADYVDKRLGLLSSNTYKHDRRCYIENKSHYIKDVILSYFNLKSDTLKWSKAYVGQKRMGEALRGADR